MIQVFNLDGGCVDEGGPIVINLDDDTVVEILVPGPSAPSAGGRILETSESATALILDSLTQYVVVWSLVNISITLPLASSRIQVGEDYSLALPVTIKNETGVNITLIPSGSDELEVNSANYQNQAVNLLPRTGGYSAI